MFQVPGSVNLSLIGETFFEEVILHAQALFGCTNTYMPVREECSFFVYGAIKQQLSKDT